LQAAPLDIYSWASSGVIPMMAFLGCTGYNKNLIQQEVEKRIAAGEKPIT